MAELLKLWELFSLVPINNDDEIEKEFLHFGVGTDRIEVMQWFESKHPDFVAANNIK